MPGEPPGVELYGHERFQPGWLPPNPASDEDSREYELCNHWTTQAVLDSAQRGRDPIPDCPLSVGEPAMTADACAKANSRPGLALEVGDSFGVVRARYHGDDPSRVYRLPDFDRGDSLPAAPRCLRGAWSVVTKVSDDDFIEGVEYDAS
jgi:hypothetical protein